jgi:imidazoleglycerol-phosphate dehydratase
MRTASITRNTNETAIELKLTLEGTGKAEIDTGVGFLDHMLTLFAHHGRFDLALKCEGDTYVDDHHTTEDIGIALGKAFSEALGDQSGVMRYGSMILPMDEALILTAVDLSGRAHLNCGLNIPTEKVGTFDTELVKEFFLGFVRNCACTLHIRQLEGENAHHIIEGCFKSFARAMKEAVRLDPDHPDEIPSTKGSLK